MSIALGLLMVLFRALFLFLALGTWTFAMAAINCPVDSANQYSSVVKVVRDYDGNSDERHCTGTILKGGCFVLTAGHCVVCKDSTDKTCPTTSFKVKSGVHSQKDLGGVAEVFLHPDTDDFKKNDVALLRLSQCTNSGMEIDYSPLSPGQEVTVGGYGVLKLNSFTSQPTRHMGKNKIAAVTPQHLCLEGALVDSDGQTLREGNKNCLPVGQDSGSPLLLQNKIHGVFTSDSQIWLDQGRTQITKSCSANLRDPTVRSFVEEILSRK